ncbi:MAG: putative rane-anchored protein [Candidatus Saccharibacteria bacterium]|nr:putative rane-anchored protein [Candidatus Saccharibacteria bacterium]
MSETATLKKVPDLSPYFWIIKILSTAMGEALSDFLVHTIDPIIAVALGAIGLIIALIIQFSSKAYKPWKYWLTVSMVAIFGTMAADVLHIGLGVPYAVSTLFFAVALTALFIVWYKKEKTLSIHSIYTVRREIFYWLTVMATFALGTAAGDMTAYTLGLGYLASGLPFAILILIPAMAYFRFKANEVLTFWIAYILTRPLGASFADWLGVPHNLGGLDLGRGWVSLVLIILIVCFVFYVTRMDRKLKATSKLI